MASNANRRSRRRRRVEPEDEPEFQVAPMIDVLLVLTLFFMSITSSELLKKDKNLQLPDATQAKPDHDHKGQIVINVAWNHESQTASFSIDGKAYADANAMTGYLTRQVAAVPNAYALVRADREAQYSNIADVMTACAAAGIGKVSFAVITSGNQAHRGALQAAGAGGT